MAFMQLAPALLLAAGIWVMLVLVVISICRAAKAGHDEIDAGYGGPVEPNRQALLNSRQLEDRIAEEALGLDLQAHPRPTRGPSKPPNRAADRPTDDEPVIATGVLGLPTAAEFLGVTPDVLLAWEARYGYPKLRRSATTRGRVYSRAEVLALAESLQTGLSIPAAIDVAQAATGRRRATARTALRNRHVPGAGPE
jgi:hypothetical protein